MTAGGGARDRVEEAARGSGRAPGALFDAPLEIVDAIDAPYETRLAALQRWRAHAADDAERRRVGEAVTALEYGAAERTDEPDEAPASTRYGGVAHDDA
ncbi:hypothetical protein [Rubrimonas cliftonensis]|uniref:Uncharacterized protein n=1 Tax=Rubrimonas cliftonensis TaxID=89524 RepID=A0A1H4CGK5_9RHOB|nr:hypothetical protein [Rubrimonas cliftonensis]SEA59555.1 hypothetical protein SAMN05444370_10767 [Rubrimonas cliftonensis]